MSKRWKLKTNSSNILLVLITLILIKAEWVTGADGPSPEIINSEESCQVPEQTQIFIGNDEISDHYFRPSTNNDSLILEGVRNCLDSFQLLTCLKMLLLSRINEVVKYVEEPEVAGKDLHFMNGLMVLKRRNEAKPLGWRENSQSSGLDEEIAFKVLRIFRNRFLLINLLPKFKIEMEPNSKANDTDFVCFSYKVRNELEDHTNYNEIEGRGRKKGGGMGMMMLVPPMIMLGLMPFTLASLKAMVMNAVMINMMALNGAIFMTVRNLVFGPRQGENVKYVNYGYSKDRQTQSKKPVLIIHSPAAFVKQPPVKSRPNHLRFHKPNHQAENYFPTGESSLSHNHHYDNSENKDYYTIQQDYADDGSGYEEHNRRAIQGNDFKRFNRAGRLKTKMTSEYNLKNSFPSIIYQRKLAMSGKKRQTDENRKLGFNDSSPGLVYSNLAGKKTRGNFNYSRQTDESSRLF